MLRGYRGILCALAGLVLAGAGPPKAERQQPAAAPTDKIAPALESIAASLRNQVKPSDLEQPCKEGDNTRSSDLCAQWKAADAADSAASATWAFGIAGSLLGALTLAAAWSAAKWARKAAEETKRGADAAEEQNRPWVEIEATDPKLVIHGRGLGAGAALALTNKGAWPATGVRCATTLTALPFVDGGIRTLTSRQKIDGIFEAWTKHGPIGQALFPDAQLIENHSAGVGMQEIDAAYDSHSSGQLPLFLTVGVIYWFRSKRHSTVMIYESSRAINRSDFETLSGHIPTTFSLRFSYAD